MMWPAILGMTYAILPEDRAGARRRPDHRRRPASATPPGPLIGGVLTDALRLALDPRPQHPDRRLRLPRHLARGPESRATSTRERIDYAGIAALTIGAHRAARGARPGDRRGWTTRACSGLLRGLRRAAGGVRGRSSGAPAARALVPRDVMRNRAFAFACLAILLMSPTFFVGARLPPAVHAEDPRLRTRRGRARPAADDGHLRARLVRRGPRSTSGWAQGRPVGRRRVPHAGPFLLSLIEAATSYGALRARA